MPDDPRLDPTVAGIGGTRVEWSAVPEAVRRSVEGRLGSSVEEAVSQQFGFSPGMASRLRLLGGRSVFIKAIGPDSESGAPGGQDVYRREARIAAALPDTLAAPRLIATWEEAGWVVLAFEDVDGVNPALPWRRDQLSRILDALASVAQVLTPSPVAVPKAGSYMGRTHWRTLGANPDRMVRLHGLESWAIRNVAWLVDMEDGCDAATTGDTLLHADVRADNILLTARRVFFVDWPHARVGAPWLDLLWFLPSVAMQGGPDPQQLFWSHPLAAGTDRERVLSALAAFAGFMIDGASRPPPPGLPNLRAFQLDQGNQAIRWLRRITET